MAARLARRFSWGSEMDAKINGWLVALVARYGQSNVRVSGGMIQLRGQALGGRVVWQNMAKVI